MEIFGIAGAAIVLAAVLPRPWSTYSAATAAAVLVFLLGWAAVPYPWVGTAERVLALSTGRLGGRHGDTAHQGAAGPQCLG